MAVSQLALPAPTFRLSGLFFCLLSLLLIVYLVALKIEPTVLGHPLLQKLHITPEQLNDILMNYQFPMIFSLILAGLCVDILGPRFWLIVAMGLAIAGNEIYSEAASLQDILIGRILIGFAEPFILIGALKLAANWLPKNHFGFFVGLLFALLWMGPQLIQPDYLKFSQYLGWDNTLNVLMAIGGIIIFCFIFTCRLRSPTPGFASLNLVSVLRGSKIWLLSIVCCLGLMSSAFIQSWGNVFLNKGFHFYPKWALHTVESAFLFFCIGAIFFGALADITRSPRFWLVLGYFIAAISFAAILVFPHELSKFEISSLFIVTSFFASSAVICYVLAYEFVTPANCGFAFGIITFFSIFGNNWFAVFNTYLLAPIMKSQSTNGLGSYVYLLALVPFALILGSLFSLSLRKPKPLFTN